MGSDSAEQTEGKSMESASAVLGKETVPFSRPSETGIWGWLWQPARGKWLRSRSLDDGELLQSLRKRSQSWFLAAERLSDQRDLQEDGDVDEVIDGLYKNAIMLSVLAIDVSAAGGAGELAQGQRGFLEAWARVEPNIEALLPVGVAREELLQSLLRDPLADARDTEGREGRRHLARRLMSRERSLQEEFESLWLLRSFRVILPSIALLVLILVSVLLAWQGRIKRETSTPWTTSSLFAEPGCTSPAQTCAEERYFFCTNEEDNPWIRFDLGESRALSGIKIQNRMDCPACQVRAVPLVVELSLDGEKWNEVARKSEVFDTWSPAFPKTEARWLRLRADKKNTYLHLKQVRIPLP